MSQDVWPMAVALADFDIHPDTTLKKADIDVQGKCITYEGVYPAGLTRGIALEQHLMKVATRGLYSATHAERNLYL